MPLQHLDWPFFDDKHRELAAALDAWCGEHLGHVDHADVDASCRTLVKSLGQGGLAVLCHRGHSAGRRGRRDRHARHLPAARDAGPPRRPG